LRLCRFRSAVTASQSVFSPFDFASLPRGCHSRIKIKKNLTARRSRHRAAKAAKTQKNKMCPDFRLETQTIKH